MITNHFLLGRGRDRLSPDDLDFLEESVREVKDYAGHKVVVRRGEPVRTASLLVEGYACRYMDDREGRRQILAMHVPGDFIDMHGYPMRRLDHDIGTIGPAKIASVDHGRLDVIVADRPNLTRALWFGTLLDAAMHREWIFRLGRLGAEGRVAHFFAELETRLGMVGLSSDDGFPLPMTQSDLGEACGITGVHANRVLRRLREDGLLSFAQGHVRVLDRVRLHRLGEFEPDYLYPGEAWRKAGE